MKLMRFTASAGWLIVKNQFYDIDPEQMRTDPDLEFHFISGLLAMTYVRENGSLLAQPEFTIDLGWNPDQDPDGCYQLTLLRRSWDDIVEQVESRDRYLIRDRMERCLTAVSHSVTDKQFRKLLRQP